MSMQASDHVNREEFCAMERRVIQGVDVPGSGLPAAKVWAP